MTTHGPMVDTTGSFTVSAWVNLAGFTGVCQIFRARDFPVSGSGCLSGLSQPRYLKFFFPVYPVAFLNRTYRVLPGQILRVLVFVLFCSIPGDVALPARAA